MRNAKPALSPSDFKHEAMRDALLDVLFTQHIDLVYVKDAQGRYLAINPVGVQVMGRPAAEVLGRTDAELVGEAQALAIRKTDEEVMASQRPLTFERHAMFPEQDYVFLTTKYPYRNDAGEVLGTIGITRDITARVRAEEAERDQRALAEALADSAQALNSTLHLDEVLDRILGNVASVVPHDAALILLVENDVARVTRTRDLPNERQQVVQSLEYVIAETANLRQMVESGKPLAIPDVNVYPG